MIQEPGRAKPGCGRLQWGRDLRIAEIRDALAAQHPDCFPLQWGRDLRIAEILGIDRQIRPKLQLQWGRDLRIAEIHSQAFMPTPPAHRFNGAAI